MWEGLISAEDLLTERMPFAISFTNTLVKAVLRDYPLDYDHPPKPASEEVGEKKVRPAIGNLFIPQPLLELNEEDQLEEAIKMSLVTTYGMLYGYQRSPQPDHEVEGDESDLDSVEILEEPQLQQSRKRERSPVTDDHNKQSQPPTKRLKPTNLEDDTSLQLPEINESSGPTCQIRV